MVFGYLHQVQVLRARECVWWFSRKSSSCIISHLIIQLTCVHRKAAVLVQAETPLVASKRVRFQPPTVILFVKGCVTGAQRQLRTDFRGIAEISYLILEYKYFQALRTVVVDWLGWCSKVPCRRATRPHHGAQESKFPDAPNDGYLLCSITNDKAPAGSLVFRAMV